MKAYYLILALSLFFFSCNNPKQTNYQANEFQQTSSDSLAIADTISHIQQSAKYDTIYKNFFYEDTLKNGYRFGMTVSEWNKHLATLAKDGTIKELNEIDFVTGENPYFIMGSYKGFLPIDNSDGFNRDRTGFYLIGLFRKPNVHNDTVEIFRRNNKIINEPILIGLQLDCDIPSSDLVEVIKTMVGKDNLKYVAGSNPITPNDNPLTPEDFSDPVAESFRKFAKKSGGRSSDENYVSKQHTSKTLFKGQLFYSSIEVIETENANVDRNSDYKIISISNGYRNYKLTQKLFSKQQFKLNIKDYMTETQLENYNNLSKTQKLIDKALH